MQSSNITASPAWVRQKMKYPDYENRILCGHTLEILKQMSSETFDTCITSPPYFGLRDYGESVNTTWDGDPNCKHDFNVIHRRANDKSGGHGGKGYIGVGAEKAQDAARFGPPTKTCSLCGAWYGQLGLEPTLDLYLSHLWQITDELYRVLKKTGVLYWNHGDCYGGSWQNYGSRNGGQRQKKTEVFPRQGNPTTFPVTARLRPKCLAMQNYRLVLGMIDRGWILRNNIIWSKPNHMPSSVKDRFTSSYEPVFMLTKSTQKEKLISDKSDARWLAGVFDGEGSISISINDKRYKTRQYCLQLQLTGTHKGFLEEFIRVAKVGSITYEKNTGYKDAYKWSVKAKKAAELLESIEQYLIVKKQQAWAGYEVWKIIHDKGQRITANKTQLERCEQLRQEVMDLNAHKINTTTAMPIKQHTGKCNRYFFDLDAVRQPYTAPLDRWGGEKSDGYSGKFSGHGQEAENYNSPRARIQRQQGESLERKRNLRPDSTGKNPGDIWTIPTQPFPEAHFATFPEKLIEPMILSSAPQWICKKCGKARVRISQTEYDIQKEKADPKKITKEGRKANNFGSMKYAKATAKHQTIGWSDCHCNAGWVAGIVLDPFAGSGTTLKVAKKLGRNYCGIELNPDYKKMADKRLMAVPENLPFE